MTTCALALAVYLLALATLTRLRAVVVPSRTVQLLKALWPSWRFFEDVGEVAVLRLRFGDGEDEAALGPWREGLPRIGRRWSALVHNAEGNHLHACESLLQLLLAEVGDAAESPGAGAGDEDAGEDAWVECSVNYRLVDEVVRAALRKGPYAEAASRCVALHYQFKLCTRDPRGVEEDVLLSPVQEA